MKKKQDKIVEQLTKIVNFTGKKIFDELKNCRSMGISLDDMLDDTDDFDNFMNNIHKFSNDYKGVK